MFLNTTQKPEDCFQNVFNLWILKFGVYIYIYIEKKIFCLLLNFDNCMFYGFYTAILLRF